MSVYRAIISSLRSARTIGQGGSGLIVSIEMFKSFVAGQLRYGLKVLRSTALGPIVANIRIDTTMAPNKPPVAANVAGVFIIRGRRIQEWSDYIVRP